MGLFCLRFEAKGLYQTLENFSLKKNKSPSGQLPLLEKMVFPSGKWIIPFRSSKICWQNKKFPSGK